MAAKRQLPGLTGLRFFLAMWVVLYHRFPKEGLPIEWLPGAPDAIYCILRTGYIAVTIFFILSGFVLSYNYNLGAPWSRRDITRFGIARLSRIYPAYVLGLLLFVPFAIYRIARTFAPAALGTEAGIALLNWSLLQSWLPHTAQTWNYPGWSLSNEAFFYACFPLVGVALWRLTGKKGLAAAGATLWAASVFLPLWSVVNPIVGFGDISAVGDIGAVLKVGNKANSDVEFWANLIRYNPLLRLPEFCVGILLGKAYLLAGQRRSEWLGKGYWLYLPGLVGGLAVLSHANVIPYPLVHNGLLLPIYACVLFGLALGGGPIARFLSTDVLVFLGNASYSMYILHAPIGAWMEAVWKHIFYAVPDGGVFVTLYAAAVVTTSCVVYKCFEEPLNRTLKQRITARLARSAEPAARAVGS